MLPDKFIRKIIFSPSSISEIIRLLGAGRGGFLSARRLRRLVHSRFGHLSRDTGRKEFPGVSRIEIGGSAYYLRLYRLSDIVAALCCLWASRWARREGVVVPVVRQTCLAGVGGHRCLAVLEDELQGRPIVKWTPRLAAGIAAGVAAFHSVTQLRLGRFKPFVKIRRQNIYIAQFRRALEHEELFTDEQRAAIQQAALWLDEADFTGDLVFSHGDLHGGNLLDVGGGRTGWLDLDLVRFRPRRLDIAAVEYGLLENDPGNVAAFEEIYFHRHPGQWKAWRRHRLRWFVLYSLFKAVRFLVPRKGGGLPGKKGPTGEQRRRYGLAHLERAETLLAAHRRDTG